MIKRAPRPKNNFLILHNETADDTSLTYRANGVLASILAKPDNWTATAEHLAAARPNGEGVKAIRTALKELEKAGYLKRERVRGEDGRFGWVQTVYDRPVTDTSEEEADVSAGQTISPKPPGGFPPGGNRPSKEVLRTRTKNNDMKWPDSDRFAPSVGDDDGDQARGPAAADEPTDFAAKRANDRALFKSIVGQRVHSKGAKEWNRGTFAADDVYNALRTKGTRRKPIDNPGAYLAAICDAPSSAGLDNWLDEQGFELVDRGMSSAA